MPHYAFANLNPGAVDLDTQFAYVDGYILALEDVLKDLRDLQNREGTPGDGALLLEQRVARNGAYGSVRAVINRTLADARDTMAMLKEGRAQKNAKVLDAQLAAEMVEGERP